MSGQRVLPLEESHMASAVTVNGRTYQFPQRPTVIVCIDGGDPAYWSDGLQRGLLPALQHEVCQSG